MRALMVVGVLMVVLGIVTYAMPSTFQDRDRFTSGSISRTEVSTLAIPPWAGGAAVATGLVLLLVGATARPRPD